MIATNESVVLRQLGLQEYIPLWKAMQRFTEVRDSQSADEIWFAEHPPVFTLGLNASKEHLLDPGNIPVVQIDRGGQVTYHGPGQLMIYPLIDLKRSAIGVRSLVTALEQTIVDLLKLHDIAALARSDAPGVYVEGQKVASVGLRVRRGCSFHGMALNISVDVAPFLRINPCGFSNLVVTNLRGLGIDTDNEEITATVSKLLLINLGFNNRRIRESQSLPAIAA